MSSPPALSSPCRHRVVPFSFLVSFLFLFFPASSLLASGAVFSQDIALRQEGEAHFRYLHLKEPDGDGSQLPGSENQFALRFRLDPQWVFDDFTTVLARIEVGDPEILLGQGGTTLNLGRLEGGLPFQVSALGLQVQTPLGTLLLGRVPFSYGLGVFFPGGRSTLERYGIALFPGTDDEVRFSFAPLGVHHPLKVSLILRPLIEGSLSPEGVRQDGVGYGGEIAWEEGKNEYRLFGDYEVRSAQGTGMGFLDLYGNQHLPYLKVALEVGTRFGRWGGIPAVDRNTKSMGEGTLKRLGYGGVLQIFASEEVKSSGTSFEGSGLELGWFSGDTLEDALGVRASWRWFSAHPDFRVGLLLFPYLWNARQSALENLFREAYGELVPFQKERLQQTFTALAPPGVGNTFYLFPGFSLKTSGELRFRLNLLYARAVKPVPTLFVVDRRGTTIRADDLYAKGTEYGFEIAGHLSYPVWGAVYGVLEMGVAFPGELFRNALGEKPPTAFGLFPRLTIFF